ncbi:MAG: hypothetical protein PHU40_12155 [Sulfurimonas sp.]|nr:hypothetical protein [Sulfurimonas sp.]
MKNTLSVISKGKLTKNDGSKQQYEIVHGWNLELSKNCDTQWAEHNLNFFQFIQDNVKEEDLNEVLESLQLEDKHWSWFNKSMHFYTDAYKWFYLLAENKIQGTCVIYQPKESVLSSGNIFYIEFIAAAPWNRKTLISEKEYQGIGTTLIISILKYMPSAFSLKPAFSLHSLPQATGYYEKLGMINCAKEDKDRLKYYEIPTAEAELLIKSYQ